MTDTISPQWPAAYDDGKFPDAASMRLHNLDGTPTVDPPAPPGTLQIPDIAEVQDALWRKVIALDHRVGKTAETDLVSHEGRLLTLEANTATVVLSINGQQGPNVALGFADVGAEGQGVAAGLMTAHLGQADPHPQYQQESGKDIAGGYAGIDVTTGKILTSFIPVVNITNTFPVANEAEMLALGSHVPPADVGDLAIRADLPGTFVLAGADPSVLGNWIELPNPAGGVISVNGGTGAVTIPSDGSVGVATLRTLGTGSTQAAAGNDARFTDARTPLSHAAAHGAGGSDPILIDGSQIAGAGTVADSVIASTITRNTAFNAHTAASTGVHGIANTALLIVEGDSRLTNSRAPSGSASGDLTGSFPSPTLTATGVAAAMYGDAGHVTQVTFDAKGRATSATSVAISGLASSAVGLGNVDNTSDVNKPVSTATTAALALKLTAASNLADLANIGTAVTTLLGAPVDLTMLPVGMNHTSADTVMAVQDGMPVAVTNLQLLANGITTPSIASGTLPGGGTYGLGDPGASNSVLFSINRVAADVQPVVAIGTISGSPVVLLGPGGSTFPDVKLARDASAVASVSPGLMVTGLTGAQASLGAAQSRWVGTTTSGAPSSGTFLQGDFVQSRSDGRFWSCTVAGSPGTWVSTYLASDLVSISSGTTAGGGSFTLSDESGSNSVRLSIRAVASDTQPMLRLGTNLGLSPELAFGPGGSSVVDWKLARTGTNAATITGLLTLASPTINTAVSGSAIDTDSTMAANSDSLLASQKAIKTALGLRALAASPTITGILTTQDIESGATGGGGSFTLKDEAGANSVRLSIRAVSTDTQPIARFGSSLGSNPGWAFGPGGSSAVDVIFNRTGTAAATLQGVLTMTSPVISGHATIEGVTPTGATGTGKMVFDGTPTLVTPVIGVASGTSLALSGGIGFNGKTVQALTGWAAPTASALRTAAPNATYSTTGATGVTAGAFDSAAHRDNVITDLANLMQRFGTLVVDLRANGSIG